MTPNDWRRNDAIVRIFAYGSVVSTYVLIVIGGYVTTSNSGLGCGESWPLCKGAVFPSLNNPEVVIELTHRLFNSVVGVFILGMGMVTVTTSLNPVVSDAHLALASAILAVVVANAIMVRNLTLRPTELRQ